jgi:hypothetical protein
MSIFSRWRVRHCVGVEQCGERVFWVRLSGRANAWWVSGRGMGLPAVDQVWRRAELALAVTDKQVMQQQLHGVASSDDRDVLAFIDLSLTKLFAQSLALAVDYRWLREGLVEVYAVKQTQISALESWAAVCKPRLKCIEPQSMALARLLLQRGPAKRAILHSRAGQLTWLVATNRQLLVCQQIDGNLLPCREIVLDSILPQANQHHLDVIQVSGDVPRPLVQLLSEHFELVNVEPFKSSESERGQFSVALGLAMGQMRSGADRTHRINFLPWRLMARRKRYVRFIKLAAVVFAVMQLVCGAYWGYLYERDKSMSNVVAHAKQFHRQRRAAREFSEEQSKKIADFSPLYQNILLREKQRQLFIELLPAFESGLLKKLQMHQHQVSADLFAKQCEAIDALVEKLRAHGRKISLSGVNGGASNCQAIMSITF